jgi:tetraspanin-13/31
MACGGFTCTRTSLAALNVFYIVIACILIGVAASAKAFAIIATVSVMGGIIACGVFLLLIAVVGLIGAIKHHQVLLFFYMIILFLLFVVQFAVACACLALTDQQQQNLYEAGWASANPVIKTKTQEFFGCCGSFKHLRDNVTKASGLGHPSCAELTKCKALTQNASCCAVDETSITLNATVDCPLDDCWTTIVSRLHESVKTVGGLGLFFSLTEIVGIWLALRYRNLKDPRANPGAFL